MSNRYYETDKITLTAFVSGEENEVQLTLPYGKRYIHLSKREAIELAMNLLLRANGDQISATGEEVGIMKYPVSEDSDEK